MEYRQSKSYFWILAICIALGIYFIVRGGSEGFYFGILTMTVVVVFGYYNFIACKNRKLLVMESGIEYYDWRGHLVLSARWDDIIEVKYSQEVDSGGVDLITKVGIANIAGLRDMYDIEAKIRAGMKSHQRT